MIWVLVAVVVVLAIALVVLLRRQSGLSASAKAATVTIEATKTQVRAGAAELTDAQARLAEQQEKLVAARLVTEHAEARADLAESGLAFTRAEMAASLSRSQIEALWAMACLEQSRTWRLTMALPQDTTAPVAPSGPVGLALAIDREVERIREETGTPGTLALALPEELDSGDAVVILKAVQGLMAVLTRYSDAFDLRLAVDGGSMVATLVCEAFDGPDTVADEVTALLEALQTARGEIDLDRDAWGRLEARLTLPLTPEALKP